MILETMSEVAIQLAAAAGIRAEGISDVCAKAPTGVQPYVNDLLGWLKYGVLAVIIGAGFLSTGALVVGKFAQMGRAAQVGATGIFWTVVGAIAFVCIYAILNAIVGNGC